MALIAMAVHDTVENKRTEYTRKTLYSLSKTVDFSKHRLIISDNGSCEKTFDVYKEFGVDENPNNKARLIKNEKNLGTAEAINKAWFYRKSDENAIKMDNDIIIHQENWIEEMEDAIFRDPLIGIIGLKRKDCWECPWHPNPFYKSELIMLPQIPGRKWLIIEEVNHVMGTCQMYSDALLKKIGYLQQPGLYGFDDSWAAARCKFAGYKSVFLPHIEIDHIDAGDTLYQKWKEEHASQFWVQYHQAIEDWKSGKKSIYYNPFQNA